MLKDYIGNPLQVRGVEQFVLQNGKGDGMHFMYVRNGLGLELWVSVDRAADIARVFVNGKNVSFFSPCGFVAPNYYENSDFGFLKSFNAGFITTCGLGTVGQPNVDNGENLPLHGTVSHIPAELRSIEEDNNGLSLTFIVRDCIIFGTKLVLTRKIFVSYTENTVSLHDNVENIGDVEAPLMILYHCNFGYPLLSENAEVKIAYDKMWARNEEAEKYISNALEVEKPQTAFVERCYFFDMKEIDGYSKSGIFNKDIDLGVVMKYNKSQLPAFTEWKMMGKTDYVMGLEPGTNNPIGRANAREDGSLKFLKPDEVYNTELNFSFITDKKLFDEEF